jgi:8-amino-7-oxononanoate synthase
MFSHHVRARLADLDQALLRRTAWTVQDLGDGLALEGGRARILLASNDYLGLARHPDLARAIAEAAAAHGSGAGAARLITGTGPTHRHAEQAAAAFVRAEAALLFSSGYLANLGVIPALVGPGDLLISDALNHASLIDGCRLSGARIVVTPHRDVDAVRAALAEHRAAHRAALVVTEALFSMDATDAPLRALRAITHEHQAGLLVDEAHALGVLGPEGRGLCQAAGVEADVLVGTLGKAMGLMGAFVAGRSETVDLVLNRGRSFVFSTGLSPAIAGAVPTALSLAAAADARRADLSRATTRLGGGLASLGYDVRPGLGPILPVWLGAPDAATDLAERLRARDVLVRGIRPPTVPAGTSRLRVVPSALTHPGLVERALEAFAEVSS